jgi:hypothetical protein
MPTEDKPPVEPVGEPPGRLRGGLPAAIMLIGSLVSLWGLSWDLVWHSAVGPDTFFTFPHLFVYSGAAITGITSLVMVLRVTAAQRRGTTPDPTVGGRPVRALGRFSAPLGYLVGGIASSGFLLYGLFDQWWHGLYGFDVTIASPPHQGWLHSVSMTMVGTAIVFAASRHLWWGRVGALTALVMYAMYASIATMDLDSMIHTFGIQWSLVTTLLLPILSLLVASQFLGWVGAVVASALTVGLNVVMTSAGLWSTGWYANWLGLSLRDGASIDLTWASVWSPIGVGLAGLLLALVQRRRSLTGWLLGTSAVLAAVFLIVWIALTPGGFGGNDDEGGDGGNLVLTMVALGVVAFVLGSATWRLGRALRAAGTIPAAPLGATA